MSGRVRVLHTESSRNLGGQELRTLLEMESLCKLGIESVLVARDGAAILEEAARRGLTAHPVPMANRADPRGLLALWRLLRENHIDVVNAHGSRDAWLAFPVARLLGLRTVRSRHVANPIRRHRLGQLVYGPLCDQIITTSESIRRGLIARGIQADKIVSVPTGVDLASHAATRRTGRLRQSFGIPCDVPLIGMISLLRGDKGPDVFLAACDIVLERHRSAWCVLVGDGPLRPQLDAQHAVLKHRSRIVFAGFRHDIPEVLAELDVSVHASRRSEGIPQVILQSHAARVPVVATCVGGVDEVAKEGATAFTAMPDSPTDLANAIGRALENPPLAMEYSQRGHDLVAASYSLDAMAVRMAEIYRTLAASRTPHKENP